MSAPWAPSNDAVEAAWAALDWNVERATVVSALCAAHDVLLAEADAELAQLRKWKAEAAEVLMKWEAVWQALGRPGPLGRSKAENSLAEVERRGLA